jgi:hypothetical protein
MKSKLLILGFILSGGVLVYAQTVSIPSSVAKSAFQLAIQQVQSDQSTISRLTQNVSSDNTQLTQDEAALTAAQADLALNENNIIAVATQSTPLPEAVDYCNIYPSNCGNWATNVPCYSSNASCTFDGNCCSSHCNNGVCQ